MFHTKSFAANVLLYQETAPTPAGAVRVSSRRYRAAMRARKQRCTRSIPRHSRISPRQGKRAVPADRRPDYDQLTVHLTGDRLRPCVHRPPASVEPRRDHVPAAERGTLAVPHPFVQRQCVQQKDGQRAATTSSSAAIAGRSDSRASQSPRGAEGGRAGRPCDRVRAATTAHTRCRPARIHGRSRYCCASSDRVQLRRARRPTAPRRLPPRVGARSTASRAGRSGTRAAARRRARRRRPARAQARVALLEVLVDHRRLGEDERVLLQDRHASEGVLLVDPRRTVVEVDLDRLDSMPFSASAIRSRAQYGQRSAS